MNKKNLMVGAYVAPMVRECRCRIEAGFAVSEGSGFDDLDFNLRDEE